MSHSGVLAVSVLFNEPKLLKSNFESALFKFQAGFSALQRAEIAEMYVSPTAALSRSGFSALQRAEIAEMLRRRKASTPSPPVSVLFNEPKLLKCDAYLYKSQLLYCFSALQRAEIAEIVTMQFARECIHRFQCSSTSRNC